MFTYRELQILLTLLNEAQESESEAQQKLREKVDDLMTEALFARL